MTLSHLEVQHIARLARLHLSQEEQELYRVQLSTILDHVARLQTLNTHEIPPTFSVLPQRSVMRNDEPVAGLDARALLQNAPKVKDGQFCIPPVFE
jgi:aspartyl-tRNA(Asn)/glutamyl-tRNA(Gln) amidotransferase subunit C